MIFKISFLSSSLRIFSRTVGEYQVREHEQLYIIPLLFHAQKFKRHVKETYTYIIQLKDINKVSFVKKLEMTY